MERKPFQPGSVPDGCHLLREPLVLSHGHQTALGGLRLASRADEKDMPKLGERQPHNKFNEIDKPRQAYAKQCKPKKSTTHRLRRRLLALLAKLLGQWNRLRKQFHPVIHLTADQERRLMTIREVYRQQVAHFNRKEVRRRIVSIGRSYIRPIVRGKESKRVEFGVKVNNI